MLRSWGGKCRQIGLQKSTQILAALLPCCILRFALDMYQLAVVNAADKVNVNAFLWFFFVSHVVTSTEQELLPSEL